MKEEGTKDGAMRKGPAIGCFRPVRRTGFPPRGARVEMDGGARHRDFSIERTE